MTLAEYVLTLTVVLLLLGGLTVAYAFRKLKQGQDNTSDIPVYVQGLRAMLEAADAKLEVTVNANETVLWVTGSSPTRIVVVRCDAESSHTIFVDGQSLTSDVSDCSSGASFALVGKIVRFVSVKSG